MESLERDTGSCFPPPGHPAHSTAWTIWRRCALECPLPTATGSLGSVPSRGALASPPSQVPLTCCPPPGAPTQAPHAHAALPSLPKNPRSWGWVLRDPCHPPLSGHREVAATATIAPAHFVVRRRQSEFDRHVKLGCVSWLYPLQNALVVALEKFFLSLPPAVTTASLCPSSELPAQLQTPSKTQGKQEPMLQLILPLFPLHLYCCLCDSLSTFYKYPRQHFGNTRLSASVP